MSSKQAIPGQKYFRRTSKSPWEPCRNVPYGDYQPNCYDPQKNCSISSGAINQVITTKIQQFSISTSTIPEDSNHKSEAHKKALNQYYSNSARKVQHSAQPQLQSSNGKNAEQVKLIYIPIQSMATLETLPPTSKKITQNYEPKLAVTKRNCSLNVSQQLETTKKDLQLLRQQNYQLAQKQRVRSEENKKLLRQNETIKNSTRYLQCQLKQVSLRCSQIQSKLRESQRIQQSLRRQLLSTQELKLRAQQNIKHLNQHIRNVQFQIKLKIEQNKQLSKVISSRQKELTHVRNELKNLISNPRPIISSPEQRFDQSRVLKENRPNASDNIQANASLTDKGVKKQSMMLRSVKEPCLSSSSYVCKTIDVFRQSKCNRYIQTQSCPLQQALKQIQYIGKQLSQKQQIIVEMDAQIEDMQFKMKNHEELSDKLMQSQILVQFLNNQTMGELAQKLANKYKYF